MPEIRFAVAEPGLDIGNGETALEALTEGCYYLAVERNRCHFSIKENLNKRFADRRATIPPAHVEEQMREEIQKVFSTGNGLERVLFCGEDHPDCRPASGHSGCVVTRPVVAGREGDRGVRGQHDSRIRHVFTHIQKFHHFLRAGTAGHSARGACKVLAWEAIDDDDLKLDETQVHQLAENVKKARRDLKETIRRTYKNLMLLGKDNAVKRVDLGLVHSSAATDLVSLIVTRLSSDGDSETKGISPSFLIRNWPPPSRNGQRSRCAMRFSRRHSFRV